jgi:EmrB/QacA subfamily drug resistance transporter
MTTATISPPLVVQEPAPVRRRWWTLAVLSLSLLVIVVDTTIVNVAIPTFAAQLHAGATALEWIVDAYTLAFAALLLPAGSLGDRYGRHRALAGGMVVFGLSSLGAALATNVTELIVWRTVMGVGAALVMPATMAVLTSVFTNPAERAKAIGIWSAVSGLGVAIGPTAGGWLLAHYSWSSIFIINVPIVAAALIAGWFLVPPSKAPYRQRFDLVGTALAIAAFGVLTYTVIDAGSAGWTSATTLVRAAVSIVLLLAFGLWELRTDHPMVDLALFRNPRFTAAAGAIMVLFFGLGGSTFVLTQIYQFVLGYSPLAAGVRALPMAAALTIAAPLGTRLAARLGIRTTVTAGLVIAAAGLGMAGLANGHTGYLFYMTVSILMSTGIGLTMAPATQSIMTSLPPAKVGIGSAVNNTTRNLGTVLGVAVVGSIAATAYTNTMTKVPGVPAPARHSIGAASQIAQQMPGTDLRTIAAHAFVHGAALGSLAAAAVVLAMAAATARFLSR